MIRLIDQPLYIPNDSYLQLRDKLVSRLLLTKGILAIYQIGSVKNPGISDLDILVVFEEGVKCKLDLRSGISTYESKILTHGLFGTSRSLFEESFKYSYFTNFKQLYSNGYSFDIPGKGELVSDTIQYQIAMEYLLRLWISIQIQKTYRVYKLRALLLEIKALIFDLELLNITDGILYDMVNELIQWRSLWFEDKPNDLLLKKWLDEITVKLFDFIKNQIDSTTFYLPSTTFKIANNIHISINEELKFNHAGFSIPAIFSIVGRKYFGLQNRLNSFVIDVPFKLPELKTDIYERFMYLKTHELYNTNHLPFFGILGSSLNLKNALLQFDNVNSRLKVND